MSRGAGALVLVLVVVIVAVAPARAADEPDWAGSWQSGPATTFPQAFSRFDGAYYAPTGMVYFLGGRLAGFDMEINRPIPAPLYIELTVCVKPGYFRSDVKEALLDALMKLQGKVATEPFMALQKAT